MLTKQIKEDYLLSHNHIHPFMQKPSEYQEGAYDRFLTHFPKKESRLPFLKGLRLGKMNLGSDVCPYFNTFSHNKYLFLWRAHLIVNLFLQWK